MVHQRAEHEADERRAGIANRAQSSGKHVVNAGEYHSARDDAQIRGHIVEDFDGGIAQAQQGINEEEKRGRHEKAEGERGKRRG